MKKIYRISFPIILAVTAPVSAGFLEGLSGTSGRLKNVLRRSSTSDVRGAPVRSTRDQGSSAESLNVLRNQIRARQLGQINEARRQIKDLRTDIQNLKPRAARKAVAGIDSELKSIDADFAQLALTLEQNKDVGDYVIGISNGRFLRALTALENAGVGSQNPTFLQKIRVLWNNLRLSLRTRSSKNVPAEIAISAPTQFHLVQRGTPQFPAIPKQTAVTRRIPARPVPAVAMRSLNGLQQDAADLENVLLQARLQGDTDLVNAGQQYQTRLKQLITHEGNLQRVKKGEVETTPALAQLYESKVVQLRNQVAILRRNYASVLQRRRTASEVLPSPAPALKERKPLLAVPVAGLEKNAADVKAVLNKVATDEAYYTTIVKAPQTPQALDNAQAKLRLIVNVKKVGQEYDQALQTLIEDENSMQRFKKRGVALPGVSRLPRFALQRQHVAELQQEFEAVKTMAGYGKPLPVPELPPPPAPPVSTVKDMTEILPSRPTEPLPLPSPLAPIPPPSPAAPSTAALETSR